MKICLPFLKLLYIYKRTSEIHNIEYIGNTIYCALIVANPTGENRCIFFAPYQSVLSVRNVAADWFITAKQGSPSADVWDRLPERGYSEHRTRGKSPEKSLSADRL